MFFKKTSIFLFLALWMLGCSPTAPQPQILALTGATLIDGSGSSPVRDAVVLVQGTRILDAGPAAQVRIPGGAQRLDLHGDTLLPGFVNAHVHFGFDEQNLRNWAFAGVTSVRDEAIESAAPLAELMRRRDAARLDPRAARLVSTGYMLTAPNGYGRLFAGSATEARQKVTQELDAGVDMIKISMEDGYAGQSNLPKLGADELAAILSAAHQRGARVSGHVTQSRYLKILVDAGVDDIAHVPYDPVPDAVWAGMVAKGIYLTPTFTVYRNYGAPVPMCVLNLRNFRNHGGLVALGNDFGGGPGEFERGIPMYEIEQMTAAGMSPMEIIVASTRNAAVVAGIGDRAGTLAPGKVADVLVVSGNPLEDLQDLLSVRMVIHDGVIIRDERP